MDIDAIKKSLEQWLNAMKWRYEYVESRNLFSMEVSLGGKVNKVRLVIQIRGTSYIVYVMSNLGCQDALVDAMRFLTMANYGLIDGNFELDVRDGEIRYKTFVNCKGMEALPEQIITDSVMCACHTYRRYSPGLAKLFLGETFDLDKEIAECEK